MKVMKINGIIAIYDSIVEQYNIKTVLKSLSSKVSGLINRYFEIMSLPYNYGLGLIRIKRETKFGSISDSFIKKKEG